MKTLKVIMAVAALFLCSAMASAFEVDGINYYVLSSTDKTVSVTSKTEKYSGDIVIPSAVIYNDVEYSVTSIGSQAFSGCSGLTSVTIPNSVTSIGGYAFQYCSGLTSVTIPNSVTSIGSSAFYGCSGLTSVTIPNSVTSIGESAFYGCSGLTSVTIPNSVTSIGYQAFYNCTNLVVTMESETPASIGSYSFGSVKSILVPVTAYDSYVSALSDCAYIIKIPFEKDGIYYEVTANKTVKVVEGENKYTGDVVIPASVTYDGVELAVTSIGYYAFSGCSGLTSVTIPNSVTSIGDYAFYDCN